MAEGTTITKMKENLECSLCLETYSDPKQLQCHHIFCLKCVRTLVLPHQNSLTCPTCRVVTPLPAGGVTGVPSAFQITPFLEIVVKSASVDSCSVHPDKELEFYCETCGVLICYKCALKGGRHYLHDYKEICDVFGAYKRDISSTMAPMEKQLTTIDKAVTEFDKLHSAIVSRQTSTKTKINDTAAKLHQNIDARKIQLCSQVDQITKQKLTRLQTQMQQIKAVQGQYTDSLGSMKRSLKAKNCRELLKMKRVLQQAKQVASSYRSSVLKPPVESDMLFAATTDVCASHGQMVKCWVVGKVPEQATFWQNYTLTLHASRFVVGPCEDISKSIDCELVFNNGSRHSVTVHYHGHGEHRITYAPFHVGNCQLHIKVSGQHVAGSPFNMTVSYPTTTTAASFSGISRDEDDEDDYDYYDWRGDSYHDVLSGGDSD